MKLERVFVVAACVVVALGLVLAFLVIGPPSHARLVALDQQRVRDLDNIVSRMHDRFGEGVGRLPQRLPTNLQARDPVTRRSYEYERLNAKNYTLCAWFALPAEGDGNEGAVGRENWPHGAGRTCYELNVSTAEVAPTAVRE